MIPEHIIDDIRRAADIVDVVSEFVRLKKRGKNYVGLCPFHTEKTGSFNVNPGMQIFKCFGCGKGGNVFQFLMEIEKVSFQEAVRTLAERTGIRIPDDRKRDDDASTPFDKIYAVLRFAANYYFTHLHSDDRNAKFIHNDYFTKQRGLKEETIRTFGLGASPNGWDILFYAARQEGYTEELLEQAGLVKKREDGSYYDAFRNRAMFPIVNGTGRVVGFGARKVFDDDPLAKYINSPESVVYIKNKILYGLYHAKDAIRVKDRAFLVEGYMDLISLHQHGITNVVASSGTSLTEGQVELLARYTKNVVIVYDADSAGAAAAVRGIDIMLERGMHVRILSLPTGDDPDTFVKREGHDAFLALADRAASFVEFKAQQLRKAGMFDTAEKQADAVRQIVQTIAKIPDVIERTFVLREVASSFDLYETDLQRELDRVLRAPARPTRQDRVPTAADEPQPEPLPPMPPLTRGERDLMRALVQGGARVATYVFESLHPEDLRHPVAQTLASMVQDDLAKHGSVDYERLVEQAEDTEVREFLAGLPFDTQDTSARWAEMSRPTVDADAMRLARDAVRALRRESLDEQKRDLQQALATAADATAIIRQIMEIDRELGVLKGRNDA